MKLDTERMANQVAEMFFADIDGEGITQERLERILSSELAFAHYRGKMDWIENFGNTVLDLLDMAANYDYLQSKAQAIKEILIKELE